MMSVLRMLSRLSLTSQETLQRRCILENKSKWLAFILIRLLSVGTRTSNGMRVYTTRLQCSICIKLHRITPVETKQTHLQNRRPPSTCLFPI